MKVKISAPKIKLKTGTQKIKPIAESLDIMPSKDAQSFNGLYDNVSVSGDNNLTAENIKKDVSIFGVEGNYEPEIKLQNKSVSITENGIQTVSADNGYDGLQEIEVTVNIETGGIKQITIDENVSYSQSDKIMSLITEVNNVDLSKVKYHKFGSLFQGCTNLKKVVSLNTAGVTFAYGMFRHCQSLVDIPILDMSASNEMGNMFQNCSSLSNESLNNILAMCIGTVAYTGVKTLRYLGLSQAQAETCMTLSNYQAFLDAGWTTGY